MSGGYGIGGGTSGGGGGGTTTDVFEDEIAGATGIFAVPYSFPNYPNTVPDDMIFFYDDGAGNWVQTTLTAWYEDGDTTQIFIDTAGTVYDNLRVRLVKY